jgi:hypothetical protein
MIAYNNILSINPIERDFLLMIADERFPSKISIDGYNRLISDAIERNTQEASAEAMLLNAILESKKITDGIVPNLLATQIDIDRAQESCHVSH